MILARSQVLLLTGGYLRPARLPSLFWIKSATRFSWRLRIVPVAESRPPHGQEPSQGPLRRPLQRQTGRLL